MADQNSFRRGKKRYPLSSGTGNETLLDADPFIFYALEFFSSVITTYIGDRLIEASGQLSSINEAVAMAVPIDPVPALASTHYKFPLLAVYRKHGSLDERTVVYRHDTSVFEVIYVLPPLDAADAERIAPLLMGVRDVLDDRAFYGQDPAYTPTNGTLGQLFWVDLAGAEKIRFTEYEVGFIPGVVDDLAFCALRMKGVVSERPELDTGALDAWNGADAAIDFVDSVQQTTLSNVSQMATYPAPTLTSLSVSTGTKTGGTTVTLTGTNFRVGTLPTVIFGNVNATAVNVVSATSATCVTPAHDAFPTLAADVTYVAIDGQFATLSGGYTFT
jgi:hypothetical protein